MKVLYTINSEKGKPGGHIFSLEHTLSALSSRIDIIVLYIGCIHPLIDSLPYKKYHIDKSIRNYSILRRVIKQEKPDLIHCFDGKSYKFLLLSTIGIQYKVVLTIPGGNPTPELVPYCKDVILFSKETMATFCNCPRFQNSNLYYIPNRVDETILKSSAEVHNENFTFLQVIRINTGKHQQILKTLQLLKKLVDEHYSVRLILAGTINDFSEKEFIERFVSNNDLNAYFTLITDERVNRGSNLLPLADCIIATGRSVMESCILGKNVLVPVKSLDCPVLLDNDSLESLFFYNFSGRTTKVFSDREYNKIIAIMTNNDFRQKNLSFVRKISREFFELNIGAIDAYINLYNHVNEKSINNYYKNISILGRFLIKLFRK